MRKDRENIHRQLCKLIEQWIADDPLPFDNQIWAACPQETWAKLLKISTRTIRRLQSIPPIIYDCAMIDGKKMTLLRLGEKQPMTPRQIAKAMAKYFHKKTGHRPSPDAFGCLVGLAEVWPSDAQLDIFKVILDDWPFFMTGVKNEWNVMIDEGKPAIIRYYEYPCIPVIRRFHKIGLEMYLYEMQKTKTLPKPSVVALAPDIWKVLG